MNRREFFSFAAAAPVALPMAAQAMAQPYATGGFVGEFTTLSSWAVGESMTTDFVPQPLKSVTMRIDVEQTPAFREMLARMKDFTVRSVAEQFHDDLALLASDDDEPHLRDTPEQQAHVSPDNKTEFPTADQDGTRQSAHVSGTLIPNSACCLGRSWGA